MTGKFMFKIQSYVLTHLIISMFLHSQKSPDSNLKAVALHALDVGSYECLTFLIRY